MYLVRICIAQWDGKTIDSDGINGLEEQLIV
jgi:hypothetical protein